MQANTSIRSMQLESTFTLLMMKKLLGCLCMVTQTNFLANLMYNEF